MARFVSRLADALSRVPAVPPPWGYAGAFPLVAIAAALEALLLPDPALAPFVLFQVGVGIAAWVGGVGPGLLTVVLSAVVVNTVFMGAPRVGVSARPALVATAAFGLGGATLTLLVATLRDVLRRADASAASARTQAEAAELLATQHEIDRSRWRGVVEGIAEEVWVVGEDGRVRFAKIPGLPRAAAARWEGRPLVEVLAAHGVSPTDAPLARALRGETVRGDEELPHPLTGEPRQRELSAAPVRDERGAIVGAVAVVRDVTESRALAAALREAHRRKDDLLVRLSHELRNPLAPIANTVTVLVRAPAGSPPAVRAVDVLGRQVKQLVRLVDDLLDADRLRRGGMALRRQRVDLAALVRDTVEDHRGPCAQKGLALECAGVDEPTWVDGDAARLVQVLGNLLQNACKFTPAGGRIDVALRREDGRAVVRVRDTGRGIAREALAELFEPFAQAAQGIDRAEGGLGIGLALVKGLVELHGGDVSASSAGPGRGAELGFRLPLDARAAPTEAGVRAAS